MLAKEYRSLAKVVLAAFGKKTRFCCALVSTTNASLPPPPLRACDILTRAVPNNGPPVSSDEEADTFAAVAKEPSTHRNGPVNQPPAAGGYRRDQDQVRADANTESNEWLINEPPGRPRRPLPAAGGNYEPNRALLQPVLPTVLGCESEDTTDHDPAETAAALYRSVKAEEPVVVKTDDRPGENEIARDSTEGQQSAYLLGHDTRTYKPKTEGASDDVATPMKVDSAVLFASLSSSTAWASISSKTMLARVEEKSLSPTRELSGARRSEVSSSTFALSTDDDDTGMVSTGGNKATLRSPPSPDDKRPPESEHGSIANESGTAAKSTSERDSESRVRSTSEHSNGVSSAETSRRWTTSPPSGGTRNLDGVPDEVMDLGPTLSPHATTTSPRVEPVRASIENQSMASFHDKERPSQGDHDIVEDSGGSVPSTEQSGYPRSTPSPSDGTAGELATKPEGDVALHSAEADHSTCSESKQDEGDAAGRPKEGTTLDPDGRGRSLAEDEAGDARLDEDDEDDEDGGLAGGSATREREGRAAGALEERSLVGQGLSNSYSVLDVGGGGADGLNDDDDGYF